MSASDSSSPITKYVCVPLVFFFVSNFVEAFIIC